MKSRSKAPLEPRIYRVIDANINRLKEGVRVVEDIFRYVYEDLSIASQLKQIRHEAVYEDAALLRYRNARDDILKQSRCNEQKRESLDAIIKANMKRAQESARVLEEIFKLIDIQIAEKYKELRYKLYTIEKEIQSSKKSSDEELRSK